MKKFLSFLLLLVLVIGSEFLINGASNIIDQRGNLDIQKENAFEINSSKDSVETDTSVAGESEENYVDVGISRSSDTTDIPEESEESEVVQE